MNEERSLQGEMIGEYLKQARCSYVPSFEVLMSDLQMMTSQVTMQVRYYEQKISEQKNEPS